MFIPRLKTILLACAVLMTSIFGLQAAQIEDARCNIRRLPPKKQQALYKKIAHAASNTRKLVATHGARREDVVKTIAPRGLCSNGYAAYAQPVHSTLEIAPSGDLLTIQDGSVWTISEDDRDIVKSWKKPNMPLPPITFTPNSLGLWTKLRGGELMYKYRVVNMKNGDSVQANLSLGPFAHNINTLRIKRLDKSRGELAFTNGTVWQVEKSRLSAQIFNNWQNGDCVIAGTNTSWWGLKEQGIIINVTTDNWVPAQRMF